MRLLTLKYRPAEQEPVCVTLPLSKSMAARAIMIGAMADLRPSDLPPLPDATDTRELSTAIDTLLDTIPHLSGCLKGRDKAQTAMRFNLGLGGTSLRFFISLAASIPGLTSVIECDPAQKHRPLAPLWDALTGAGAEIEALERRGYPPLRTTGQRIKGGEIRIKGSISSQYTSSILMVSPYWTKGLSLLYPVSEAVSQPYIGMTVEMMRRNGIDISYKEGEIIVKPGEYNPEPDSLQCEPCWSSASYFYEMALLDPDREIMIRCLMPPDRSAQGDSQCCRIFAELGITTTFRSDGSAIIKGDSEAIGRLKDSDPITLDLGATPDLVPAVAVGLCLAGIRFSIRNIAHLRHKESDRIFTLSQELEEIGYGLETTDDTIAWHGRRLPRGEQLTIRSHGDHRIAMAFAMAAIRLPYLTIEEPDTVNKSFPGFFDILAKSGFEI